VPVSAANKQGLDEALDILFSLIYRI